MYYTPTGTYYVDRSDDIRRHLARTYGFMAGGLALTFVVAFLTALFMPIDWQYSFPLAIVLLVAEVITVVAFSATLRRAKFGTVLFMFFFYAFLTGVSISYIFVLYDLGTIYLTFAAASVSFAIMAILGHTTKKDLSAFGHVFLAGIVGLLLITVVGFFIRSTVLEIFICCIGLILFLGVTAYDAQRAKGLFESAGGDNAMTRKFSVFSALQFYLDFINIFFYLLRLFGNSRR